MNKRYSLPQHCDPGDDTANGGYSSLLEARARFVNHVFQRLLGGIVAFEGSQSEGEKIHFGFRRLRGGPMIILTMWEDGCTVSGMRGTAADAVIESLRDVLQLKD